MRTSLYLDELEVGQTFSSGTHEVTEAEIKEFAAKFDPQPFHLYNDLARDTIFGGLAASGWHIAAITMRLLIGSAPPFANGIIGIGGEIAWPHPTRPGDRLKVDSVITEITPSRSKPDRGVVTVRSNTSNQQDEIVQTFTARVLVFRNPHKSGEAQRPDS